MNRIDHPILSKPWEYQVTSFAFRLNVDTPSESCLDMTFLKDGSTVILRFEGVRDLTVESGFPMVGTHGLYIEDVSSQQLDGINILVDSFEQDPKIKFYASYVERVIVADEVGSKLLQWKSGELSTKELHDWAECRYGVDGWAPDNESVNEVLGDLDRMNINLRTKEDIPILLTALTSQHADVILHEYCSKIDINQRKRILSSDHFYAPFCKGP